MRFFNTLLLLSTLSVGVVVVTALPVSDTGNVTAIAAAAAVEPSARVPQFDIIKARAESEAQRKAKHDANHVKKANGNCGTGCRNSLSSYHSEEHNRSQASANSRASQRSRDSKTSKGSKGKNPRGLDEDTQEPETSKGVEA
ncbi:hypothetical protein CTA2_11340 [Colletotrichum tanaceti]|uniref:Uncharacterized protein n=1 Tax=Colletotrichum tanaceti TaxID=1306861 RepID=A0A4U6X0L9_9PEZI|nr:hypothetical protein CTA2_11340 [Colletotrichum tanaceti]TKW48423.1 hypothetical protein CTA1_13100 [Colletotrichum tanaceti]